MEKVKLPFNLPVNLQVTSYYRDDKTSHNTRQAIDFFPLIDDIKDNWPRAVAIYTATYLALFSHLKYSQLRINGEFSNWHYHFFHDPGIYAAGIEHYIYNETTREYEQTAPTYNLNAKEYGFSAKLSSAIGKLQDWLLRSPAVVDVFTPDYWRHLFAHFNITNQAQTYVYFDPKRIDGVTLSTLLRDFDRNVQWTPAKAMLPAAPGDIDKATEKLLVGAAVIAGLLFLRD